jgi:carboxypeptidase family protein
VTTVVRRQLVLAGRVVDDRTGEPLAGALVVLTTVPAALRRTLAVGSAALGPTAWEEQARRPDRARADAGGRFAFLDLPSGAYTLEASRPGSGSRYGTAKAQARVTRDSEGNAAVALVEIALPSTTVTGTVTADGKPVVLASVEAKGSPERTFTDARGRYVLSGLEAGERTLLVRARGYEAAEKAAVLAKPGAAKTVDVTLTGAVS